MLYSNYVAESRPWIDKVDPSLPGVPAGVPTADELAMRLLVLALSLVASFIFAGTETSLTGMGEHRVRKLIEQKIGNRRLLTLWISEPSQVLTTLLAGNTLANILSSAIATSMALRLAHGWGLEPSWVEAAAISLLTVVILIGGEIAPKTLAKSHPDWFVPLLHVVWAFHQATRWLTWSMIWVAMHIVRALGGKETPSAVQVTEEQIEDMVRIGSEAGSIDEDRGDILQNVFDLNDLTAKSIMTPRTQIDGLPNTAGFSLIAETVRSNRFSRYPVYEKSIDKIIGFFNAKDLLEAVLDGRTDQVRLSDHIRDLRYVHENKKVIDLLKEMRQANVWMAVVVDEHGGTAGIVTMEDVLEQLVGEIYDEYDHPGPAIVPAGPDGWHVDAQVDIRELNDLHDLELPENAGYSTVGGFLVDELGHVPVAGEELQWQALLFRILQADDTRVIRVEIRKASAGDRPMPPAQGSPGLSNSVA